MARRVTLFTGQWADLPLADVAARAAGFGYDGLELACWGDHLDVERAAADPAYCAARRALLEAQGLGCWAISNHLAGQLSARAALLDAGAAEAGAETFEAHRIAQGVPAWGAEFGMFNNPLEARLLGSISDDKGCYTGQEVIARLQTYRKVQRLLMAFTTAGDAAPGDALEAEDGSPAGVVTSAYNAGDGRALGLALVASKFAVAGSSLRLSGGGTAALSEPAYALATEPVEA